ncbi:MAG TPA: hypothetical protein VE242_04455 [Chthoniobacterales bacterium]|nr:hypothetical protein [Chthoniobacterales bacterium]
MTTVVLLAAVRLFGPDVANAQDANPQPKADREAADRIREAALDHSQIPDMLGYFTGVIGPRLTGSPNLKRAEEYALGKLREWGLADARLEAWGPFGRGWTLTSFTANMTSPEFSPMIAYPKAWSPGTNGVVRGKPVFVDVKTVTDLENYRGKLRGKIVLFESARHVDPLFEPPAHGQTDEELLRLANDPPMPARPFQFSTEQRQSVAAHFGKKTDTADAHTRSEPVAFPAQYENFDAYFNFDYGTGRIRGKYLQGNEAARPIFRTLLEPSRTSVLPHCPSRALAAITRPLTKLICRDFNGFATIWRATIRVRRTPTWTLTTTFWRKT